jgi:hypothetical protein
MDTGKLSGYENVNDIIRCSKTNSLQVLLEGIKEYI